MPGNNEQDDRWRYFREPFRRAQRESRGHAAACTSLDGKVILVLLTAAVSLTLQEYLFQSQHLRWFMHCLEGMGAERLVGGLSEKAGSLPDQRLAGLTLWAVGTFLTYFVIPALVIKLVFRAPLRDYGCSVRGMFRGAWAYPLFFAVLIPWLLLLSGTESFQAKYPFYRVAAGEPLWPRFWIWELFYAMQFFCLEFFFRGFILHGTRHRFGFYSIFVMMVPYCMIHFGKPMPETFGAIGAGIVLGFMSLKTRSVWLGAVLHVAVALSMDLLALRNQGLLG